jgi:hypothetical protein
MMSVPCRFEFSLVFRNRSYIVDLKPSRLPTNQKAETLMMVGKGNGNGNGEGFCGLMGVRMLVCDGVCDFSVHKGDVKRYTNVRNQHS